MIYILIQYSWVPRFCNLPFKKSWQLFFFFSWEAINLLASYSVYSRLILKFSKGGFRVGFPLGLNLGTCLFLRCIFSRVFAEFLGHSLELSTLIGQGQNIAESCVISRAFWVIALSTIVIFCPVSQSLTLHKCNFIFDHRFKGTSVQILELFLCVMIPLLHFAHIFQLPLSPSFWSLLPQFSETAVLCLDFPCLYHSPKSTSSQKAEVTIFYFLSMIKVRILVLSNVWKQLFYIFYLFP